LMDVDESRTSFFGPNLPCYWIPHHTAHLAYAFYASPYQEAEVLAIDGLGDPFQGRAADHAAGRIYHPIGTENGTWDVRQPEPVYIGRQWDDISSELFGSWQQAGTTMALVGIPDEQFTALTGFDLSVKKKVDQLQVDTTETFLDFFSGKYPAVLSGGCALNGIANYEVLRKCGAISVPPAAGDGGIAVGAALYGLHVLLNQKRAYYTPETIAFSGCRGDFPEPNIEHVADEICAGKIVPFTYGRAESGPRALGHRSFLASPTLVMRDALNCIKGRQAYRPTAPVVTLEYARQYFDLINEQAYHYMTVIADAKSIAKKEIPAALHYDGSARIQIARPGEPIEALLQELVRRGRPPCLLNTSLNLKGMPLVNEQKDMADIMEKLGGVDDDGVAQSGV